MRADVLWNGRAFILVHEETALGEFHLPVYPDRQGQIVRVCLTPMGVALDASVVAVVAGVIFWIGAAGGNQSIH